MLNKLVLMFALVALIAVAGTVPTAGHYRITLRESVTASGVALKAGEYRLNLLDTKATFIPDTGKDKVEVTVKVETVPAKFNDTIVQISTATGKPVITEIRLGGTKTKLLFE